MALSGVKNVLILVLIPSSRIYDGSIFNHRDEDQLDIFLIDDWQSESLVMTQKLQRGL
jgi:hypothetical protein